MIAIQGKWFDGQTSAQIDAVLKVYDNGAWQLVRVDNGDVLLKKSSFTPQVSPRLANTARMLTFDDGSAFETLDNQGVDKILTMLRRSHWSTWVHMFESRMRYILPAIVIMAFLAFAVARYGVPAAAKVITAHLPQAVFDKAGEQTLSFLDRMIFEPTALDDEVVERVRRHFQPAIDAHPQLNLQVMFREGGRKIGPNAFALPGGQIIFTDRMVEIADSDDELLAVLVHEIGHVVHQHGMRRVVQDSLLSFAILAVTGDASGVSELFLGLPVVLTELAYSRGFENEADRYALDYMQLHGIPAHHFADILMRISAVDEEQAESDGKKWSSYLSTHPSTGERIKAFRHKHQEP